MAASSYNFQGETRFSDGCSFVRQAPEEYSKPKWKKDANVVQVPNISLNWFNKCLQGLKNDKVSHPKMTSTVRLFDLKETNKQTKN